MSYPWFIHSFMFENSLQMYTEVSSKETSAAQSKNFVKIITESQNLELDICSPFTQTYTTKLLPTAKEDMKRLKGQHVKILLDSTKSTWAKSINSLTK